MFKERLKKLRLSKGMTQEQLADNLGLPHSTIRRYESMVQGYPKEERLQQLADFFNCSVDYLLGRETKEVSIEESELDRKRNKLKNIIDAINIESELDYMNETIERLRKK